MKWKTVAVLIVVSTIVFYIVPILISPMQRSPILMSTTDVRRIVKGMIVYASENEGKFPPQDRWAQQFLELGIIHQDDLISEADPEDKASYIFIPGPNTFDPYQIVIYEKLGHWNKVIVGFADAHAEMIDHETFERMLAEQLEGQESAP